MAEILAFRATPTQIVDEAIAAFRAAAIARFDEQGRRDVGTCGGYTMVLDGRSAVSEELLARKLGFPSTGVGVGFAVGMPDDVQTQSFEVSRAAGEAARAVFEKHGVRIVEAHAWVD